MSSTDSLEEELIRTVQAVTASGAISMSGHGNVSLRVPGRDELLFTAGGSLSRFERNGIVRLALDGRILECWTEAFGIFGLQDGVPVAGYGPRGSRESVDNIRAALGTRTQAVLLANHGVLAFHQTATQTVNLGVIIEEAAQSAVYATGIGGARVIPAEMLRASHDRAAAFQAAGVQRR